MLKPPCPCVPPSLLERVASLEFLPCRNDYGTFAPVRRKSVSLGLVAGTSAGSVEWAIFDSPTRLDTLRAFVDKTGFQRWPGLGPMMFDRWTFDVLKAGAPSTDGGILYEGQLYRLGLWFDGREFTAKAILVGE